jgi:tetratricopeptide (TPR) repeat protein
MEPMLKKQIVFLLLFYCFLKPDIVFATISGTTELSTNSFQNHLVQAIRKSFNLEDAAADTLLKKAIELEPENPTGYAMEAMLHLLAYEMCFSPERRQKEKEAIFHYTEETFLRGQKRLFRHPKDSQAYLAMALAKIAKASWAIKEKHYLVLIQETSSIWDYLEAAKSMDPHNDDVDFLMGLLHYHIDHFAGMIGIVSSLMVVEGNRRQGLTEIQTTAQKGYLLREMAQAQLASIYLTYEKQPAKALPILEDLKIKFPNNYHFHFTYCLALLELNRFAEAEAIASWIAKQISTGTPPFVPQLLPRYYQLIGRMHFKKGEYGRAESFFQKAATDKAFYNIRTQAKSLLYIGMIHDIRQERKYAEDYYRRVLKMNGAEGSAKIEAKEYLKKPYRINEK